MYQVKDVKPIDKGLLKAEFTLKINDMEIRDWTYLNSGSGGWVNSPSRKYTDNDGNDKYFSYVYFPDKDRYAAFQTWCVAQVENKLPSEGVQAAPDDSEIQF